MTEKEIKNKEENSLPEKQKEKKSYVVPQSKTKPRLSKKEKELEHFKKILAEKKYKSLGIWHGKLAVETENGNGELIDIPEGYRE